MNPNQNQQEEIEYIPSQSQSDDDSTYVSKKKPTQVQRKRKLTKNNPYQLGHWTYEEHELYLQFLKLNYERCMQERQNKIFKQMASFIVTRSPAQCRSHHQKFNPLSIESQQRKHRLKKQQQFKRNIESSDQPTLLQEEDLPLFIHSELKLTMYSDDDLIYERSFEYFD